MKIKTRNMTGPALDWAVAKCWYGDDYDLSIPLFDDGLIFAPSTNWAHGGPIIEREYIDVEHFPGDVVWQAQAFLQDEYCTQYGPTPLVAAMRCYVASRLGDEVDVPEELTGL